MMAEISVPLPRTGRKKKLRRLRDAALPRRFTLAENVADAMGMLAPPA